VRVYVCMCVSGVCMYGYAWRACALDF